jgi:hypothetical protein
VLLSPLTCCGSTYFLNILPSSFFLNLFKAEVRIENRTNETLYITAITTTRGYPEVIRQPSSIKQRDFPLRSGQSQILTYDIADAPLAGIAVCRSSEDCRLLGSDYAEVCYLDAYEDYPLLEPEWLETIRSSPERSMGVVIIPVLGLVPIILFISWLYLVVKEKKSRDTMLE